MMHSSRNTQLGNALLPRVLIDNSGKSGFLSSSSGSSSFNRFHSLLKSQSGIEFEIEVDGDELNLDRLQNISLLILCYPCESFDNHEIRSLINYVESGGKILFLCNGENIETTKYLNDDFLSKFGNIQIESSHSEGNNTIINIFYEGDGLYHPKECYIDNCVCNSTFLNQYCANKNGKNRQEQQSNDSIKKNLCIVYPYGSSLLFDENTVLPLLSSQDLTFPSNRCICACYQSKLKGKVVVIASYQIFDDYYINKKDNTQLLFSLIDYMLNHDTSASGAGSGGSGGGNNNNNHNNKQVISSQDKAMSHEMNQPIIEIPNIENLSENVQSCLQEPETTIDVYNGSNNINNNNNSKNSRGGKNNNQSNNGGFENLFEIHEQFGFSNHLFALINNGYKKLNINKESLELIKPQFELPLPPLQCAVFEPTFLEPNPPNLELFDIDTQLANTTQRLKNLFDKCNTSSGSGSNNKDKDKSKNKDNNNNNNNQEDTRTFINGSAEILGILSMLKEDDKKGKGTGKDNNDDEDRKENDKGGKENSNNSNTNNSANASKSKQILNLVAKQMVKAKFFDN